MCSCSRLWYGGLFGTLVVLGASAALSGGKEGEKVDSAFRLKITSRASLVHLGSLDSFDRTRKGTDAARLVLDSVEHSRAESAEKALMIYNQIIPGENFGGEYTALQWLCEYLLASPEEKARRLADKHVASFYHLLADNNYAVLREYLRRKYKLGGSGEDTDEALLRYRFHEDFILFNNPRRERWEKSSRMIDALGLKKGDVVADIGAGPGYFSFKFADIVGDRGRVYAIDTNEKHREYVARITQKLGIWNVEPILSSFTDIGLPPGTQVDCAYLCSVYHVVYCTNTEEERAAFLDSIKRCLKPNGTLVIVDNALVEDKTLPYHGPHIAKELIIAQLKYHGFTLVATHQFIPQRYMLVFRKSGEPPVQYLADDPWDEGVLAIRSAASLVQFTRPGPGPGFTSRGRKVAKVFYQAINRWDAKAARTARANYEALVDKENLGSEYSAFIWYCDYLLASPASRKEMLQDRYVADYFRHLGGDRFTLLKQYVRNKYFIDTPDEAIDESTGAIDPKRKQVADVTCDELMDLHEFIAFNSPRRETWEKTSNTIDFLKLRPGMAIADIGCGPGYYTYKFSDLVGKEGRVYAVDTSAEVLNYVFQTAKQHRLTNVFPIRSAYNDTRLPANSADVVFLCSLYHAVYATSMEYVRDEFLASIHRALRKNGRLVVVDNDLVRAGQVPYAGPRIDRRLVIQQLKYYGFRLVDSAQFIPQRYILVFERDR